MKKHGLLFYKYDNYNVFSVINGLLFVFYFDAVLFMDNFYFNFINFKESHYPEISIVVI